CRGYLLRIPVSAKKRPTITVTTPPTIIHMDRSVGFPVKNRDTSELNECDSLRPKTNSTIPSARMAKPTMLFMALISCRAWDAANGDFTLPAKNLDLGICHA